MSSAACWSASTARAGEAVRPAVPKLETFLEDTWNQEHARIAKDRQRLRTGSCWAGRDPRASRGPQAFAPKRATISCNMTHWSSRSVRAAQESHRLRSGNRRLREDKSPTGLACVSGALLLNAFARSPSGGPPLLVVRAGLFDGHGSRAAQRSCGSAENPAPISGISRPLLRGTTTRSSRTVASNLNRAAGKHRARLSRKCTAPCA